MRNPRLRVLLVVAAGGALAACASTITLDHAVLSYDQTTAQSISKQLLLNIARARHNEPMHFTAISNIAATYKFNVTAGIGAAQAGDKGELVVPMFSTSAEE